MISKLLNSTAPPIPLETRKENLINGKDAELFVAVLLITAFRAEVSWGSSDDDDSKIDIRASYKHPFHQDEKVQMIIQIKSGPVFGEILSNGVKIKTAAIEAVKRKSSNVCLFWVDRTHARAFWVYVHPQSKSKVQVFGSHHEIGPASAYDLWRCIAMKSQTSLTGGRGIVIGKLGTDIGKARKEAKTKYRNKKVIVNPLLGGIHITRMGWRHMLRCSRNRKYKEQSLRLVPHLGAILSVHPNEHAVLSSVLETTGDSISRRSEHLLVYSEVKVTDSSGGQKKARVIVRVIEEIRFPKDWSDRVMLSQCIEQKAALKSAYFKCIP